MCEICQFVESLVLWFYRPRMVIILMVKNLRKKQVLCLNWLWDNGAVVTTCLWAIPVINERFTTGKCQEWSIMSYDYYLFSILWFVSCTFIFSHVATCKCKFGWYGNDCTLKVWQLMMSNCHLFPFAVWGESFLRLEDKYSKVKERVISKNWEFAAQWSWHQKSLKGRRLRQGSLQLRGRGM